MDPRIERLIGAVLRQHDGLCLDRASERKRLVRALTEALSPFLTTPAEEGTNLGHVRPAITRGGTHR